MALLYIHNHLINDTSSQQYHVCLIDLPVAFDTIDRAFKSLIHGDFNSINTQLFKTEFILTGLNK